MLRWAWITNYANLCKFQTVIECQVNDILARLSVMTECAHDDVIFDELRTCVNHPHANAAAVSDLV